MLSTLVVSSCHFPLRVLFFLGPVNRGPLFLVFRHTQSTNGDAWIGGRPCEAHTPTGASALDLRQRDASKEVVAVLYRPGRCPTSCMNNRLQVNQGEAFH